MANVRMLKEDNRESVTGVVNQGNAREIPRQEPKVEILISTEHKGLTPIFGTSCPPKGFSGVVRRLAYRYSEGQKVHWLMLILADRIDVLESAVSGLLSGKPDHLIAEMGLRTELKRGAFLKRFGHGRADTRRWGQQALLALGVLAGVTFLRRRQQRGRLGRMSQRLLSERSLRQKWHGRTIDSGKVEEQVGRNGT